MPQQFIAETADGRRVTVDSLPAPDSGLVPYVDGGPTLGRLRGPAPAAPPSREANAELDRLTKELAAAKRDLEAASEAVARLDAVIREAAAIHRELTQTRAADATALGEWIAAGGKGKRPGSSISHLELRRAELAEDWTAVENVGEKYRSAVRDATARIELLSRERNAAAVRASGDPNYFVDQGPTLGRARADDVAGDVPPANIDVPAVLVDGAIVATALVGQTLTCTSGNWSGEPTRYAFQWKRDVVANVGTDSDSYVATPNDEGCSLTCVVSAYNIFGLVAAPPSNAVAITAASTQSSTQGRGGRRG